jgi:hypothetical protein
MGKKAEKEVKISPKKLEKIEKKLAEFEALKKALGWDGKEDNPGVTNRDLLLFMVSGFSDLDSKLSWLIGASVTAVALLIALAVAVF